MSATPPAQEPSTVAPPGPPAPRGFRLSEDWLATITGLVILALVLAGVITKAMIP